MSGEPGPDASVIAAGTVLCPLSALRDGVAREIHLGPREDPINVVVFREGGAIHAYRNRCAHFHLPLNAQPGRFLLLGDGLVMCAWHSAVFRIADGACIDGPAQGIPLERIAIREQDGNLLLDQPLGA